MRVGSVVKKKGAAGAVGFTITELLVVMAIIGVLAAIVFPVIIKTQESAKVTECLSNMRQLATGLSIYLGDFSDRYPAAVGWGSPSYWAQPEQGSQKTIQELLSPYVRNGMHLEKDGLYHRSGVFGCPSDIGMPGDKSVNGVPPNQTIWKYAGCSYEYYASDQVNWQSYDLIEPWTGLSPQIEGSKGLQRVGAPLGNISNQTRKAVLGDTWYWHMGDRVPDGGLAYRNTLFADGHAARVTGTDHEDARLQPIKPWHDFREVPGK